MHEVSVAQNILGIVINEAEKAGAASVTKAVPTIGKLSEMKGGKAVKSLELLLKKIRDQGVHPNHGKYLFISM
jgi:Zn finger protein HypA/HybF involved in hydrogenase expression